MERPFLKRGFIYNNISVAPRQTFSLWTQNVHFKNELNIWIQKYEGGELFEILLYNQISILMTHMNNYGGDRLAFFLLENVFELISKWTNLIFFTLPPLNVVEKYFEFNQNDKEPLCTVSL